MEAEEGEPPTQEPPSEQPKYVPPADDYKWPLLKDPILRPDTRYSLEQMLFGMEHPGVFSMAGIKPHRAFLLNGPPGVGKNFATKAVRNELIKRGRRVVWVPYDIGVYGTAYINMGAVRIQKYFDSCRKAANDGHIVLSFWDEADVIFGSRNNHQGHKEDTKNLETIMKNMNDIKQYCEGIYFVMCTNFPSLMDAAAVRSGRVDKVINFCLPDDHMMTLAYNYYLTRVNDASMYKSCDVRGLKKVVRESRGFNFADVQTVVDSAVRDLLYDFVIDDSEDLTTNAPKVRQRHLLQSVNVLKKERAEIGATYKKRRIGFI